MSSIPSFSAEGAAIGLVAILILLWIVNKFNEKIKSSNKRVEMQPLRPPGPYPWPIIGNLHMLGKLPHRTLQNMAKKYGPIMFLRLGSVPTVVVSSPELAKEFLKIHDLIFTSRPITSVGKHLAYGCKDVAFSTYGPSWRQVKKVCVHELLSAKNLDMAFATYGPYWRHVRKVCVLELLSAKRLESFGFLRKEHLSEMIHSIWADSRHGKIHINLSKKFSSLTSTIILKMVTGRKYSDDDLSSKGLREIVQETGSVAGAFNVGDFIPYLEWLDLQGVRRSMKRAHKIFDAFCEDVIDEHVELRNQKRPQNDFVNVLLEMAEANATPMKITRENIKALMFDMMLGGMETSANTLDWAMSELLRNPSVMKRVQEELYSVVSIDRLVEESDLGSLEYLQCVVKETLRLYPAAPLMVPHESIVACDCNCSVGRYHIPAKTRLIVNVWAIGRDPKVWEDPLEFKPERFMGKTIDLFGDQDFEPIPFGSGRRVCPGALMALRVVEFALAQLLHCFEWSVEGELNMWEAHGVTLPRQVNLYALPMARLPSFI